MKRRTAFALSLLALGSAGVALASVARADAAGGTRTIDQDVDLAGAAKVAIASSAADIVVRAVAAGTSGARPAGGAHLSGELRGVQAGIDAVAVRLGRAGDTITITIDESPRHGWFSGSWSRTSARFELTVAVPVDVSVTTASGNATVDGVPGAVGVRSASGNVSIRTVHGAVGVRTRSGNVGITDAATTLGVSTTSGNVRVGLSPGWQGEAIGMNATSGNIRLAVPAGFHAALQTHSASGTIRDEAQLVQAAAPVVSLRTASGNIQIVSAG